MEYCDKCGQLKPEVRLLPLSKVGGNLIICEECFMKEIEYRILMKQKSGGDWDIPTWTSLKKYQGG